MNAIGAARFKATCLAVLDQVERTGEPVLVTKRGRPVVKVVPVTPEGDRHPQDSLRGSVTFLGDVISPALPPEAWEALRNDNGADPRLDTDPGGPHEHTPRPGASREKHRGKRKR